MATAALWALPLQPSFAFILGVFPLAVASDAGAEMRQSLGTAALFGVIGDPVRSEEVLQIRIHDPLPPALCGSRSHFPNEGLGLNSEFFLAWIAAQVENEKSGSGIPFGLKSGSCLTQVVEAHASADDDFNL